MSMDLLEDKSDERDYALERLIMLSDGVFAIAITLLALELRPPEHWRGDMASLVSSMARPFGAFLISFLIIAWQWISHRRMFSRFRSADLGLTILNIALLGLITLVPVAANLMVEAGPRGAGYVIYVGVVTAISVVSAALWAWPAFAKPQLFRVTPPVPARVVVLAVMLIPAITLPVLALMSLGVKSLWGLALIMALVAGVRALRVWANRSGSKQWMP